MITPVILCGGNGSRLWPLSRQSCPKQYLKLSHNSKNSLLQNTYKRISSLKNVANPILICNEEHRFIAAEQMREISVNPHRILLEPFGRNTAPAIALSAIVALEKEQDPILLVLSADHEIRNENKFLEAIEIGLNYANDNKLVTFGVIPNTPETGYGYIKAKESFELNNINGYKIASFVEKPNYQKACEFLKDKRYSWNSGIFLFKARKILQEINELCPEIVNSCKNALNKSEYDLDFQRLKEKYFLQCPNKSIDVAVMEKTNEGIVIPLDAGWSDIGSWGSIWENSKKDSKNNVLNGNIILEETKNCYFRSENKLVVGIGLNDLVVVNTNDALLVANKQLTQKVKNIVQLLNEKKISTAKQNLKSYRPWGSFTNLEKGSTWQVKRLEIKPNSSISLQMHHHRSEHWIIVDGLAKVEIEGKISILKNNESTYIPKNSKHRLSNVGNDLLILIEVQSGDYLGEDDIIRFEDNYGRTAEN